MARLFFFLLAFSLSFTTHALVGPSGLSPHRPKGTSFREMAFQHGIFSRHDDGEYETVFMARKAFRDTDWSGVPEITAADLTSLFQSLRDERPLTDGKGRVRRLTWLYPDDGCYARAEMMNGGAGRLGFVTPAKIFVFGNLQVNTDFHPDGLVTWWYHVAPVVRVGADIFVLDPAIDPYRPLPVREWVGRMQSEVDVSLCSSHSYDPHSLCDSQAGSQIHRALQDEDYFLTEEWSRILDLGRNPEHDLGEYPPWSGSRPLP